LTSETTNPPRAPATASLTAFDWLNTIMDQMLLGGEKALAHPAPQTAPVPFAQTLPAIFAVTQGPASTAFASEVLDRVVLGYAPMVDRQGAVVATRLTVVPMAARGAVDAAALLRMIGRMWPEGGGAVALNIASDNLLADVLKAAPARNVMVEVSAAVACDPGSTGALLELADRGNTLLLRGRPPRDLPRQVLRCFLWSIIDVGEERRADGEQPPQGVDRRIKFVQSGVRTMAQFSRSIERGAVAVLGWPLREADETRPGARLDLQVIVETLNRIDRCEPVEAVERTLVRDPVLAFELMRHANERQLDLPVEVSSFRHAIMMLGYQELGRWLASALGASGDEHHLRPVNFAALRRGLFMRELAHDPGDDETHAELFMCGVFSLLDRLLGKPMDTLLAAVVLPERVRQALVDGEGPFMPMLAMARAVESERPDDIRAAAEALYLEPIEVNKALVRALTAGHQVGG
jgi:EAL and modified HD-GYP domain-containing signal transduction protein